jgi:hypothetical protein
VQSIGSDRMSNFGIPYDLSPIDEYTLAAIALAKFEKRHQSMFEIYRALKADLDKAEAALKEDARYTGPCENGDFIVTVQTKSKRWYDADKIIELAPWVRDVPGVVVTTINRDAITALVKIKTIPEEIAKQALHEEPMTPAVTIKAKPKLAVVVDTEALPF